MQATRDRREDRKDNISGRNKTRLELWEEHLRDPIAGTGQSVEVRGRIRAKLDLWPETLLWKLVFNGLWPRGLRRRSRDPEQAFVFGPIWIRGTACVCAQHPRIGMSQGSMGRTVSSSFPSEERADGPQ